MITSIKEEIQIKDLHTYTHTYKQNYLLISNWKSYLVDRFQLNYLLYSDTTT